MYVTLAERLRAKTNPWRPVDTSSSEEEKHRQVFRGFVGGAAFMTKKGYRGLAVETSWSKNILFSFDQDDVEITVQALKSSLADLNETVIGGEGGAPFSIGDYGFFTEDQFKQQGELLRDVDRVNAERRKIFFSQPEWKEIDKKINSFAEYGSYSFNKVVRGDNFGMLALRRDAFAVAKYLLTRGVDPLKENNEGHDMYILAKEAYRSLTLRLKMIAPRQDQYLASIQIRTELESLNHDTAYLGERFAALKIFVIALQDVFQARIENIQNDIHFKKRCELLNQICPVEKLWNIDQLGKLQEHVANISTLIDFAQQKVDHSLRLQEDFVVKLQQSRNRTQLGDSIPFSLSPSPALISAPYLSSPTPSHRLPYAGTPSSTGFSTPTKQSSAVSLPPIMASPSAQTPSSVNRTPTRHNQANYTPILGTISQSEHEVVFYR